MKTIGRQAVSIRLESAVILHLRRLAREESLRRDRDTTMADLIREALERVFPLPEKRTMDSGEVATPSPNVRRNETGRNRNAK